MAVFLLSCAPIFPPVEQANSDGLLAVGGDLAPDRLLLAYQSGIFPWFGPNDPIMWWSPNPRLVLYPKEIHVSRSLKKLLRQQRFQVTFDHAFDRVIQACRDCRQDVGTWILPAMIEAYERLYQMGYAHSVEVWDDQGLSGGLYGLSIGRCFFGESMFSHRTNASKIALVCLARHLRRHGFHLIDCQVTSDHLKRMGAREIPRWRFLRQLQKAVNDSIASDPWALPAGDPSAAAP
jgi:leucyl/phenylalanyl-tRNA--protein transferase